LLADDRERLPARGEDLYPWRIAQEPRAHLGGRLDHVLAVVQDDQRLPVPDRGGEAVDRPAVGATALAERSRDGGRHVGRPSGGAVQRGELHQPGTVGVRVRPAPRHRERQARLADPARSGERHEPGVPKPVDDVVYRRRPADEGGQRGRQVGAGRGR
jgi:hypothetical protein